MYTLEFSSKGLPKTTNSKRRFGHWSQYHRETQKWKQTLVPYLLSKRPMDGPLQKSKIILIRRSSVEPDFDGLVSSFKHILDSMVDAKIIANDKPRTIFPEYKWEKTLQKKGNIVVYVQEI